MFILIEKIQKVVAENNVRILDRNGNIIVADKIELSEDFKNGIFTHIKHRDNPTDSNSFTRS